MSSALVAAMATLAASILALGWLAGAATASTPAELGPTPAASSPATIVLFHGDGCPHCAAERAFLADLVAREPRITVEEHEVWYDPAGQDLLLQTATRLGFEPTGVPVTVIGDEVWIGFDESTGRQLEAAARAALPPAAGPPAPAPPVVAARVVDVPLLGPVPLADTSLLGATLAIGFVDGVNPCSLWVLSLLLAMVLNRGSRGRVLVVGGTFLAVTSAMYAVYMLGLYSAASYLGAMGWLRIAVAAVAGVFGLLQLKDGLGIRTGPSLSVPAERRPGLYARMRALASPDRTLAATLGGTVVLAVAVSLLETPCTAGLPLLWTTLLAEQGVGPFEAAVLFAAYLAVFLLDELVIFAAAVITLRATRLQERHGRALKLLAGSVLLTLGITMLVAPQALSTLTGTLVVFAVAVAVAAVLHLSAIAYASVWGSPSSGPARSNSPSPPAGPSPAGSSPAGSSPGSDPEDSASTSRTMP